MRRRGGAAGAATMVAAILVVVLAGCADAGVDEQRAAGTAEDATGGSAALRAELAKGPAAGTQIDDREIVYTGSMTIGVDDAEEAAGDAAELAAGAGGFVAAQDSQLEGDREVTITLRVPADEFESVADGAAELGTVRSRSVDSEDVTDQVVDLEGRLENAQASADRLRELLSTAEVLDNIVALEERLAQREADIEQIQGQLEVFADRVELATLELRLTEQDAPAVSDDLPGPLEALRAGAVAVGNLLLVLLAAAAFLVPFAPFLLAGWWVGRRLRRRQLVARDARRAALATSFGSLPAPPVAAGAAGPAPTARDEDPKGSSLGDGEAAP